MFEEEDDLLENIVYERCKACGSDVYDNADFPDPDFSDDGKIIVRPTSCDQCNFSLVLSDSPHLH